MEQKKRSAEEKYRIVPFLFIVEKEMNVPLNYNNKQYTILCMCILTISGINSHNPGTGRNREHEMAEVFAKEKL